MVVEEISPKKKLTIRPISPLVSSVESSDSELELIPKTKINLPIAKTKSTKIEVN